MSMNNDVHVTRTRHVMTLLVIIQMSAVKYVAMFG